MTNQYNFCNDLDLVNVLLKLIWSNKLFFIMDIVQRGASKYSRTQLASRSRPFKGLESSLQQS